MDILALYQIVRQKPISTDTRNIIKDSVFFALKGESFDGNTFAEKALENGASYAIIDNKNYLINEKCILVDDVIETLQKISNLHRKHHQIPYIGITGTNGKTTTKELISCVLRKKYSVTATIGNLNNHIGVPLTLLSINEDTEIAIIEMGANHPKEIDFLCKIAEPQFGIITNIGKAHLEGFGSYEGVINTKNELYKYIDNYGKLVFVNGDNELLEGLSKNMNRNLYFTNSNSKIKVESNQPYLKLKYYENVVETKIAGTYNFENIMAAISVGLYFNVDEKDIIRALEEYTPNNNRSQIIETKNNEIIMDAYNANPSSMKAAFENFNTIKHSKKIAILGDMFELGKDSIDEHENIINIFKEGNDIHAIFIGKSFYLASDKSDSSTFFENMESFKLYLEKKPITDSLILLKGSRGMKMEQLLSIL